MSDVTSIEILQTEVTQITKDLDDLKKLTDVDQKKTKAEEAAKKVKTTKETITKEIEALKLKTDTESVTNKTKLEKMFKTLETLETSNTDLAALKTDINKNRIHKQRDGVTDKDERKTNTLTNVARVAGGLGAAALVWKGVKWLFGGSKDKDKEEKKDDNEDKDDTKDEKTSSSFGSKVWKFIKYGGLAVGGFFGLKMLIGEEKYQAALDRLGISKQAEAPVVSVDDTANTITGLTKDMEYSTDNGTTYIKYDGVTAPTFAGVQKVLVRTAKTTDKNASKTKELSFTKNTASTTPSTTPSTNPEQITTLTADEITKRNTHITDSITNATAFPVTIDYGTDKTTLEAKGCPKTIDFDTTTQSILFGKEKLKVSVGEFTKAGSGLTPDAKVSDVTINGISYKDSKFSINVTGTAKTRASTSTETADVDVTKDQLLSMLTPYYEDKKETYPVSLSDDEGTTVPITIEKTGGSNEVASTTLTQPTTEYEKEFVALDQWKQDQYTTISTNTIKMYYDVFSTAGKDRLPKLLGTYDSSISQYGAYPGSLVYLVDKTFPTIDAFITDGFFDKVKDTANIALDSIAEFLFKFKDNTYFGSTLSTIATRLKGSTSSNEEDIKTQLKNDTVAQKKFATIIKQISVIRFFVVEKKAKLKAKYIKDGSDETASETKVKEKVDSVEIAGTTETEVSLYNTLKDADLLDSKMSTETDIGVKINAAAKEIQTEIENEDTGGIDLSGERGKIEYDYKNQTIKSRGESTEIEIDTNGNYRIKDLGLKFDNLKALVYIANISNWFIYKYGKNNLSDVLCYDSIFYTYPGIYNIAHFLGMEFQGNDRLLSISKFCKYSPEWSGKDEMEVYVSYINKKLKLQNRVTDVVEKVKDITV